MNKEITLEIFDRLKTEVPELRWIDLECGQLDNNETRAAVAFPACLVDIAYPGCEDVSRFAQNVTATVTLRLAFKPGGATSHRSPVQQDGLNALVTVEKTHTALQGWGTAALSDFSRRSAQPEKRRDGLRVFRIAYETSFREDSETEE